MRGARTKASSAAWLARIIPADAGSTLACWPLHLPARDHPRGCGEHPSFGLNGSTRPGSSPRMRGALTVIKLNVAPIRIIPADAGSTAKCASSGMISMDHPRGCGEHSRPRLSAIACWGSSPRMRGAPANQVDINGSPGIIPADAGSTKLTAPSVSGLRDHPRGCGEHAYRQERRSG